MGKWMPLRRKVSERYLPGDVRRAELAVHSRVNRSCASGLDLYRQIRRDRTKIGQIARYQLHVDLPSQRSFQIDSRMWQREVGPPDQYGIVMAVVFHVQPARNRNPAHSRADRQ